MKRVLRIATACLVMIALLVSPVAPCFAANNQQNTISSSQLAASQSVQTQGAKQILEQAIKDIQALSNPNPDEKPSYNLYSRVFIPMKVHSRQGQYTALFAS